jgi:hypothetical protein
MDRLAGTSCITRRHRSYTPTRRYQSFSVKQASPSAFELHGPLPPPIFLASKVIQPALEGEDIPCDG